jgi:DNA-binding LytR/AlgR family response regulator
VTDFTIGTLRRDDFVLLTDDIKCWIVDIEDISLLEARQNFTLVHFAGGKLLIRASRAPRAQAEQLHLLSPSRGCIVNLNTW